MPSSVRRCFRSFRIWSWIVTSSAVLGSSASRMVGLQASAIAISTRCRIPPENSCGYSRNRRSGRGIPTRRISSIARSRRPARLRSVCWRSASVICSSTRSTGFRKVIGSWKIIEISPPRSARSGRSRRASTSRPPYMTRPDVSAWLGSRRISERSVALFPQPDSPTTPKISPRSRSKLTPSTASTVPASVLKRTCRSSTRSSGSVDTGGSCPAGAGGGSVARTGLIPSPSADQRDCRPRGSSRGRGSRSQRPARSAATSSSP